MKKKRSIKLAPGTISIGNMALIEREYLLSLAKLAKPKTEIEERILQRFILRMIGKGGVVRVKLYPDVECSICESTFSGNIFDRHFNVCKEQKKALNNLPEVDPTVFEMLGNWGKQIR